jgi:hypothetical protein
MLLHAEVYVLRGGPAQISIRIAGTGSSMHHQYASTAVSLAVFTPLENSHLKIRMPTLRGLRGAVSTDSCGAATR